MWSHENRRWIKREYQERKKHRDNKHNLPIKSKLFLTHFWGSNVRKFTMSIPNERSGRQEMRVDSKLEYHWEQNHKLVIFHMLIENFRTDVTTRYNIKYHVFLEILIVLWQKQSKQISWLCFITCSLIHKPSGFCE